MEKNNGSDGDDSQCAGRMVTENPEPGARDAMQAGQSKVSWVVATIVSIVLAMTATGAANAETGGEPPQTDGRQSCCATSR